MSLLSEANHITSIKQKINMKRKSTRSNALQPLKMQSIQSRKTLPLWSGDGLKFLATNKKVKSKT